MAEEVSPESKVYVKEEIDKMRKEFKEDLEKANSRATKTFAIIAMIVGLLGSLGIYGLVKSALSNTAIKNIERNAEDSYGKIDLYEKDANEILSKLKSDHFISDSRLSLILSTQLGNIKTRFMEGMKLVPKEKQVPEPNGYAWSGDIKLVWGKRKSNKAAQTNKLDDQEFKFVPNDKKDDPNYNFDNECCVVICDLEGDVYRETLSRTSFQFRRHGNYDKGEKGNQPLDLNFVAIGY